MFGLRSLLGAEGIWWLPNSNSQKSGKVLKGSGRLRGLEGLSAHRVRRG